MERTVFNDGIDGAEGDILPLSAVAPGSEVTLVSIIGGRGTRLKLVGMGLGVGMRVRILSSVGPGPCVIVSGNRRLALGRGVAKKIMVRTVTGP